MSSTYAYTLDEGGGSVPSPQPMPPMDDDDDYICLTCETECTCPNRLRGPAQVTSTPAAPSSMTGHAPPHPTTIAAPKPSEGDASPPASTHPSLKIKLTLRPPTHSPHASAVNARPKKKKNSDGRLTTDSLASIDPSSSTSAQALAAGHGAPLNVDGILPKKRGRPTKALIAARDAAKGSSPAEARHSGADTDLSVEGGAISRQFKQVTSQKSGPSKGITTKKGKKLHGAAAASKARADLRRAQQHKRKDKRVQKQTSVMDYESSELSELDDEEGDEIDSLGLPTFISAFSSSSNSSSSESESDSEADSAERFPHNVNSGPKQPLGHDHTQRKRVPNRVSRPRKKNSGEDNTDADVDADSDAEDEEDEADADANDEDADGLRYAGIATGWTDDEESSFDADLFFANLSDSTVDGTEDEAMGDEDTSDEARHHNAQLSTSATSDFARLSEFAAAGFLAPFAELENTFGNGWDQPLLSTGLRDMLDLGMSGESRGDALGAAFEFSMPGIDDGDAMMATSEEEEAVAMFDNDAVQDPDEEVVEIFEDSDGGETTEDEYVDMDGIATPRNLVLLRFPASLGAIDPMSTVNSPVRGSANRGRSKSLATPVKGRIKKTLKPHEILSGKGYHSSDEKQRPSLRVTIAPAMGSFATETMEKTKRVVLAGSGSTVSGAIVPSPYPAIRRLRKRTESLSLVSNLRRWFCIIFD